MNILLVSDNAYDISRLRLFAQKNEHICATVHNLSDCHRYLIQEKRDIIVFDRNIIGQGSFSVYTHLQNVVFDGIALVYNDTSVMQPLYDYWMQQNKDALKRDDSGLLYKIITDFAELLEKDASGLQQVFPTIQTIRPQSRKLLNMFLEKKDGILNMHTISTRLWGDYSPVKKNSVYACICELRKILQEQFHGTTQLIKTEKETYKLKIQDWSKETTG